MYQTRQDVEVFLDTLRYFWVLWGTCAFYPDIIFVNSFTRTKFLIEQIFPPILPQKTFTRHFLQNIGNPVQGKVKGQVDPAPVHIKQPHKALRHTRQLSFDEVFYNFHVLEINSYITSEVFLTNIKYVWVSWKQYFEILLGTLRYFWVLWGTFGYF